MTSLAAHILHVPAWLALLLVFAFPALEASTFLGVVFPGEIACLLGGVLAFEAKVSLFAVIVAAILGAIVGDSIGFAIGSRYGDAIISKLPKRLVKPEHVDRTKALIRRFGGRAVFLGRFTAALRALVPGFAGLSKMSYRQFLVWNAAGGIVWATGVVVAGYLTGNAWRRAASDLSVVSYVVLGVLVVGALIAVVLIKRKRKRTARSG